MAKEESVKTKIATSDAIPEPDMRTREEPGVRYKKLYRLPKSGKLAGVCAGLADYLDMDVTLVRIIFVVLTLASGGFGLLVYLILAVIIPVNDSAMPAGSHGNDLKNNLNTVADELRTDDTVGRLKNFIGLGLVLLGLWLLLVQFFPQWIGMNWSIIWPALLVLLGIMFVTGSRR